MSLHSPLGLWLSVDYCSPCMWVTDTVPSCAAQSAVPFAMPANICSTKTISSFQHSNGGYTICQQATQFLPGELGPGCIRRGNNGRELIFLSPLFPPLFYSSFTRTSHFLHLFSCRSPSIFFWCKPSLVLFSLQLLTQAINVCQCTSAQGALAASPFEY